LVRLAVLAAFGLLFTAPERALEPAAVIEAESFLAAAPLRFHAALYDQVGSVGNPKWFKQNKQQQQ
jgi:hypothetical protein